MFYSLLLKHEILKKLVTFIVNLATVYTILQPNCEFGCFEILVTFLATFEKQVKMVLYTALFALM